MDHRPPKLGTMFGVGFSAYLATTAFAHAADAPLNYLTASGYRAAKILPLTWGLLAQAAVVIVIISALVLVGILIRRSRAHTDDPRRVPITETTGSIRWIAIGVGVSTLALLGSMVWTVTTMAAISTPPREPAFTIEVRAHQWWWEVRYLDSDPSRVFTTANEIHLPVGEPVRVKLISEDVIHSFWVPAIADKTDVIPGQTNEMWLEADRPGIYRGQCSEYCGQQHAHMAMTAIADPPDQFQAWWNTQLQPAPQPASDVAAGRDAFLARCAACHTVRGSPAGGRLGPDLSHLMSRSTIAAGTLPNTVGYLSGWIANPQRIKPGSQMPDLDLSGPELASIRSYVETLK